MANNLSPGALGVTPADLMAHDLQRAMIYAARKLVDQVAANPAGAEHREVLTVATDLDRARWNVTAVIVARRVP